MQAFITVGLGYGDEGKGATTEALVNKFDSMLVVRYSGGAQCGHNVVGPKGQKHPFAQWGAGTITGAHTHLLRQVIIDPLAMRAEASALEWLGWQPWPMLTIDRRCLVTTPFHARVNRWLEQMRQHDGVDKRHGSCGLGIGETRQYWLWFGEDAVFAEDLQQKPTAKRRLAEKLDLLRQRLMLKYPQCRELYGMPVLSIAEMLCNPLMQIVDEPPDFPSSGTIVFEGAQGVLLDEHWGQPPHYTWSDVTPRNAIETAIDWGIRRADVKVVGVLRTYATRHGAGPLEGTPLPNLRDSGNPENPYQGSIRFAEHSRTDVIRAAEACKYPSGGSENVSMLDGLAVNCLDQHQLPEWVLDQLAVPVWMEGRGPHSKDRTFLPAFE